jgi:hypothetical protein
MLGPLEGANLSHWKTYQPEDGSRSSARSVVFSNYENAGQWIKSKSPALYPIIRNTEKTLLVHDLRDSRSALMLENSLL